MFFFLVFIRTFIFQVSDSDSDGLPELLLPGFQQINSQQPDYLPPGFQQPEFQQTGFLQPDFVTETSEISEVKAKFVLNQTVS